MLLAAVEERRADPPWIPRRSSLASGLLYVLRIYIYEKKESQKRTWLMDGWNGFFVQRQLLKVDFRAVTSYLSLSLAHFHMSCTRVHFDHLPSLSSLFVPLVVQL